MKRLILALVLLCSPAYAVTVWGTTGNLNVSGVASDCASGSSVSSKAVTLQLPVWANGAEIEVTGTFVATWTVYGSTDGVTYRLSPGQSSTTYGFAQSSAGIGSLRAFGPNIRYICVGLTAFTSGAVVVAIEPHVTDILYTALGTGGGGQLLMAGTSSSLAQGAANSSSVSLLTVQAATIGINSTPAVNTQATATVAAGGATVRHIAAQCSGSINTVAAQPGIALNLRDGATGAGTIIWSATTNCAITSPCSLSSGIVNIIGTANTAMTCEWSGIPAVGNFEVANLEYKNAG